MIFDDRQCILGEGPLWHPALQKLFWFDIIGKRLMSRDAAGPQEWRFDDHVSAAGWIDDTQLLIASDKGLHKFDTRSKNLDLLAPLEPDNAVTRSNDGRADPWGGFWIGTMGFNAEPGAGAIYRYYRGEVKKLYDQITVPNAICFSPGRDYAYFSDTPTQLINRQKLDPRSGWPEGPPEVFIDLRAEGLNPDGAVVDAEGNLWNAQWEASRVAVYSPKGEFIRAVEFPALKTTCPALGGSDLGTLFCTSAAEGLDGRNDGMTFTTDQPAKGQPEHQVLL